MDTNQTNLGYVEETIFGTTPSANLQLLRRTGGSISPSQNTITSGEIRSDLRAGAPIRTSQMASGDISVEWSYTTLDEILEGIMMNAWSSNVLTDGTTKKSYTFEEQYVDTGVSPSQYMIFKGCRIASVSMSLALDSIVTGSFGVMAATPSIAQASAGTGNTAATTTEVWNCVDMVTSIQENSAAISKVMGVELQIDRSIREKREIGSLNPFDLGVGRCMVTGSITQHFEDDTLMDAYFAFGDRDLSLTFADTAGNQMLVEIPQMKYVGDAQIEKPGPDTDVLVTVNFQAYAAIGADALIRFTRTAA